MDSGQRDGKSGTMDSHIIDEIPKDDRNNIDKLFSPTYEKSFFPVAPILGFLVTCL